MSDVLAYITTNSYKFPLKLTLATSTVISSKIQGHTVKEIKVVKSASKKLPIPIRPTTKKSPERIRPAKSAKSPQVTPAHSPKTLSAVKVVSPKGKIENFAMTISPLRKTEGLSPRQDIGEILKQALQQQKTEKKAEKKKNQLENELKLKKKMKLKVFDEFTRRENLQKFKQKFLLTRPKWGLREKKEKKVKNSEKKEKKKKGSLSFDIFATDKVKKHPKKKQEVSSDEIEEFEGRKVRFSKPTVTDSKPFSSATQKALQKFCKVFENLQKKLFFSYFHPNSIHSFSSEDIEVQQIMQNINPERKSDPKPEPCKSYEKLLENQVKINLKRQMQLITLKSKDLQEMNKLAEVLGGNPEVKNKFQEMIDRRYSKLEDLFEENLENIKQALGLENFSIEVNCEDLVEKKKSSEFSSSFLKELNVFPVLADDGQEWEKRKSPEMVEEKLRFVTKGRPAEHWDEQEEPSQPLVSESLIIPQESEESAFTEMISQIKSQNLSEKVEDASMDLKPEIPKVNNQILILEDSFSSSVEAQDHVFSSISGNQPADTDFPTFEQSSNNEKLQIPEKKSQMPEKKSQKRLIAENFPKHEIQDRLELSTETEGFGLIIQRVIFTLETDILQMILSELLSNSDFLSRLPEAMRKSRSEFLDFDKKFETDPKTVLTTIEELQRLKPKRSLIKLLQQIFDPLSILSKIQENFEEIDEDVVIFEYDDLEFIEKCSSGSEGFSRSEKSENYYFVVHNKMLVDVLNEAIVKTAKRKMALPWKIQEQPCVLQYEKLLMESKEMIAGWCKVEAGKIPSVEMINSFGVIDEDRLVAARQDRLAQFLILDNREADNSWVLCEFEEAQVAIDVGDWLFSELMIEAVEIIISGRV